MEVATQTGILEQALQQREAIGALAQTYGAQELLLSSPLPEHQDDDYTAQLVVVARFPESASLMDIWKFSAELDQLLDVETDVLSGRNLSPYLRRSYEKCGAYLP